MMNIGACKAVHEMKAVLLMLVSQVLLTGVNVLYQVAALDGMNLRILVAYRCLLAAAFLCPLALYIERKKRPKLTWTILGQSFLSGLLGGTLAQNLFLEGMALTSTTFTTAMSNLVPAITFLLAVCFRLESLRITSVLGKVKLLGTVIGVGGAMILTFYKGVEIKLFWSNSSIIHTTHQLTVSPSSTRDQIIGLLLCLAGSVSYACWLIVQAKVSTKYPCFYSSTALMNLMAFLQSLVVALVLDHRDWEQWKLGWDVRLLTVLYTGIVGSGLTFVIASCCIHLRGPLFVSIFSPLLLLLVVLANSFFMNEKLFLGSVLGGLLIVSGLYMVLWGKAKEMKRINQLAPSTHHGSSEDNNDDDHHHVAVTVMEIAESVTSPQDHNHNNSYTTNNNKVKTNSTDHYLTTSI